jgi:hypothetical protein
MKAEERHRLEENALNRSLNTLAEKARSGDYLNTRTYLILGATVLIGGLIGYWIYASRQYDRATSRMWTELEQVAGPAGLEEFARTAPDQLAGRVARLQLARVWLGPEGLQRLSSRDIEVRRKAIENIEKAREEFLKLADEFQNDTTLQAQSIDGAANAELALVGIPKDGTIDEFRGSVDRAADLFLRYAKVVGETTPPGEAAKKRAEELTANRQKVLQVAQALHNRLTPATGPSIELPKGEPGLTPDTAPKPPDLPIIPPPAPPEGILPPASTTPSPDVPPPANPPPPTAPTPPPTPSIPPPESE